MKPQTIRRKKMEEKEKYVTKILDLEEIDLNNNYFFKDCFDYKLPKKIPIIANYNENEVLGQGEVYRIDGGLYCEFSLDIKDRITKDMMECISIKPIISYGKTELKFDEINFTKDNDITSVNIVPKNPNDCEGNIIKIIPPTNIEFINDG